MAVDAALLGNGENGMERTDSMVTGGGSGRDFAALVAKLAEVMGAIGSVEKNGYNKYHNYEYATESDIVKEVREYLARKGIFIFSTVKDWETSELQTKSGKKNRVRVEVLFTFADGETGATCTVRYIGEGIDGGDKAFYKAYTGALKYVVMKNFLIPAGGSDPEEDSPQKETFEDEMVVTKTKVDEEIPSNNGDPLEIIRRIYRHSPDLVQEIAYRKLKKYDMEEDISLIADLDAGDLREIKDEVMAELREQVTDNGKEEADAAAR